MWLGQAGLRVSEVFVWFDPVHCRSVGLAWPFGSMLVRLVSVSFRFGSSRFELDSVWLCFGSACPKLV